VKGEALLRGQDPRRKIATPGAWARSVPNAPVDRRAALRAGGRAPRGSYVRGPWLPERCRGPPPRSASRRAESGVDAFSCCSSACRREQVSPPSPIHAPSPAPLTRPPLTPHSIAFFSHLLTPSGRGDGSSCCGDVFALRVRTRIAGRFGPARLREGPTCARSTRATSGGRSTPSCRASRRRPELPRRARRATSWAGRVGRRTSTGPIVRAGVDERRDDNRTEGRRKGVGRRGLGGTPGRRGEKVAKFSWARALPAVRALVVGGERAAVVNGQPRFKWPYDRRRAAASRREVDRGSRADLVVRPPLGSSPRQSSATSVRVGRGGGVS